jgi:GNAT superfamily N-acetyltransferase
VPRLAVATSEQIDAIYRESFALWGAGLTFEDYRAFWNDLSRAPWAQRCLDYLVWLDDDGTLLSSMKLYRPGIRLRGRIGTAAGIGAVFTPHKQRRKGHGSAMLREVVARARDRGDLAALLFSDVGTEIYGALGFRTLPSMEAWGKIPRWPPRPPEGWSLLPMGGSDLEFVRRTHETICCSRPLGVVRDADHWAYLVERSRSFFRRLDGSDLSARFQVAFQEERFGGYLVSVASGDVWIVREVEAVDDDPASLTAILRAGAAQARARGLRQIYGWLPRRIADLAPEWRMGFRPRRRAIPMILPLDDGIDLAGLDDVDAAFIPYLDQF